MNLPQSIEQRQKNFNIGILIQLLFSFPLKIQCTPLSLHTYIHIHTKEGKGWRNHYTAHNIHFCLILFMNFCHQNIQSFYLLQPTNLSTPLGNQTDVFSLMILYRVPFEQLNIPGFYSSKFQSTKVVRYIISIRWTL